MCNTYRTRDVDALRVAEAVEVPPAFAHAIADFEGVDLGVLAGERDHGCRRVSEDVQLGDVVGNGVGDRPGGCHNLLARFQVTPAMSWLAG